MATAKSLPPARNFPFKSSRTRARGGRRASSRPSPGDDPHPLGALPSTTAAAGILNTASNPAKRIDISTCLWIATTQLAAALDDGAAGRHEDAHSRRRDERRGR